MEGRRGAARPAGTAGRLHRQHIGRTPISTGAGRLTGSEMTCSSSASEARDKVISLSRAARASINKSATQAYLPLAGIDGMRGYGNSDYHRRVIIDAQCFSTYGDVLPGT